MVKVWCGPHTLSHSISHPLDTAGFIICKNPVEWLALLYFYAPQEKDKSWCTLFVRILHAPQSPSYTLKNVVVLENFILIKEGEKYVLSFTDKLSIPIYLRNLERDASGAKKTLRANEI